MKFVDESTLLEQGVIIHTNVREAGILLKTPTGLAIKCFKSKGYLLSVIRCYTGRTKAHKQWNAAQKLIQLELKTPQPIEVTMMRPGSNYEAAFTYKYKEDAVPFHDAIKIGDATVLLKKLAQDLATLAHNDALFIDFHLGNVLVDSANDLWWIDPEIKISRPYTQKRFWSRILRMHKKCDPGVLNDEQFSYFTSQLNSHLPSWLQDQPQHTN